jgi:hypothetical protein
MASSFGLLLAGAPAYGQDLQDGLIAWWRMEDRGANTIPDASGAGHTLYINGSPTFEPVSQPGGTLVGDLVVFDNDGILLAEDSDALDLLADWTISVWVREDGHNSGNPTNGWIGKVRSYHDPEGGWFLSSDNLHVWMTAYGSPNFNCLTPDPLNLGTWYRLTATYDDDTQTTRIYQNSTLVAECVGAILLPNTYQAVLGGYLAENMTIVPYCQGALADVRIYERTLGATEVEQLASRGLTHGLIAWWRMEDRVGITIPDASASGHTLQINGTPTFAPVPQPGGTLVGDMVVFNNDGTLVTEDSDALDLLGDWTISFWVREDGHNQANPTNGWIEKVRAYHDPEGGWAFVSDDTALEMTIYGTPNFSCNPPNPLELGVWYRLTATLDSATHTLRIYRDETLLEECTAPALLPNVYPVVLGGNIEENMYIRPYCMGAMVDVRLYDRTLSPNEIAQLALHFLLGDMNCDGVVDFDDINPFVLALSNPSAYSAAYPNCDYYNGDCDGDGHVTFSDINCFVALLSGQ